MSGFLEKLLRQRGEEHLKPLEKLAQKVGNELYAFGLKQGKSLPGLIKKANRKVKLPPKADGYVFWLLVEEARFWPPMSSRDKEALQRAVSLMEKANATPPLDGDYELPSEDAESDVENVIEAAARWAANDLRQAMVAEYKKALDKHKAEAAKIMKTDSEQGRGLLSAALLTSIKRQPRWFKDADFLYWAYSAFIP